MDFKIKQQLEEYSIEMQAELKAILQYWIEHTIDNKFGGFYGQIDEYNCIIKEAPKGAVMHARILWAFAAAFNLTKQKQYLEIADRAFNYISTNFIDQQNGGIYWSINFNGVPFDSKKQIYALAFLQYGCSEYYKCNHSQSAKQLAIDLYYLIQKYSFDKSKTGYLEAFTKDWKPIADLRLSEKDANEKKTMNTHLHILEAYTNLYRIWPDANLKQSIYLLIKNFTEHIIDKNTWHLNLFFNEDWEIKSNIISYGHDIEAAWLLQEAAEVLQDEKLIQQIKIMAFKIAGATMEGLDKCGGLWYEKEGNHLIKEKHWWPQAEVMVGFFNVFQITKNENFLNLSNASWDFIKQYIRDNKNGEWFWGVDEDNKPLQNKDKVGIWKCPYHNSRACIEIIKRIGIKSLVVSN